MRQVAFAFLLASALAACAPVMAEPPPGEPPRRAQPRPAPSSAPIVIRDDRGGNVLAAVQRRAELQASGREVRIGGYCRSACTMYLSLPRACLEPGATLGFHAPRLPGTTVIPPLVDQIMAEHYRGAVRERWLSSWSKKLEMTRLSAAEYRRLDPQMRVCD